MMNETLYHLFLAGEEEDPKCAALADAAPGFLIKLALLWMKH